jgi:hypothetical protein
MIYKPMTVGQLRESLPEPGSPEYDLPIKVYASISVGVGVHNHSFESGNWDIDDVVKISELTKPEKDFFRIEIKETACE